MAVATPANSSRNGADDLFSTPTAYLFPGQGAQEVGMGRDLYTDSPAARRIIDDADKALGFSLSSLMFNGPADELERTINTQPAILTVSLACLAAAREQVERPLETLASFMAGHSLGEYTALAAAGVLETADAVWLVRERGRLMQEACDLQPGAMAAIIGMELPPLEEVCQETNTQIANINSPGQVVISGSQEDIARAVQLASERGARRAIPLKVSGAFHSYLMGPALEGMLKAIGKVTFHNTLVPIVANCTSKPVTAALEIKDELAQQLCGCVRWQESVSYMVGAGVGNFIEFGPGKVLTGMVKRIASSVQVANVNDLVSARSLATFQHNEASSGAT
ncbi:MAG: ACP S-malonyltransferase [Chloroflexi bacterium]|nr:ACP S-malonyltransferase [Chloroflexota bacterium]